MHRTHLFFFLCSCATNTPNEPDPSPGELEPGFQVRLVQHDGCQDTWMHSWNDADTIGMELYMKGLLAQALEEGPVDDIFAVGEEVKLIVDVGSSVSYNYCGDEFTDRRLTATYNAVSGQVRVFMSTFGSSVYEGGEGGFELLDVLFEDEHGHQVTVEQFDGTQRYIEGSWGA